MNDTTHRLHVLGQSLWLDSIGRDVLRSGTLARCIAELSITGATSNPTAFGQAIDGGPHYDASIRVLDAAGLSGEELLFELAMEDLTQAADLLRPVFEASQGIDGWMSLDVSPLLADNTTHTIQAADRLFKRGARTNLLVKIPGTPEGLRATEEVVFGGIPVNVTLLFSREHYLAAGLDPKVESVASLFVSRWDAAVKLEISSPFHNRLGIAMAMRTYRAHRELLASERWQRLAVAGARAQRLLWISTGTQDAAAPDTLYVQALAAAGTINASTEKTLLAFADHGRVGSPLPVDGGYADAVLEEFRREGVDDAALAERLQREGVEGFARSWHATLSSLHAKCAPATSAGLP
jgi:transaldolase